VPLSEQKQPTVEGTLERDPAFMESPWLQQPSQPDIDVAKNFRLNVFGVSASGLWLAEPDGNLIHIFMNNDWMNGKKK
jgi:hypothetical protein